ncbi:MAG TPA: hypothetical protein VL979_14390 [Solirubrobacteraceae bacterium]|nr:hypothetical protein [Solirubrobacteraceae bacterium]
MQRRLDGGAVIRRVFDIYVDQAPVLMPAAAVVFVLAGLLRQLLVAAGPGTAVLGELISLIAGTLFTGMVVELVADVQDGRRDATAAQLLRAVTPVLGQLILVGVLVAIGVLVGLVALIVPGLIALTLWSVAAPVVVLERPGAIAALGRSRELVRGNGWQVFGVIVVLDVMVLVAVFLLEAVAAAASSAAGLVVAVVLGVLSAPIPALAAAVLYFELRGARAGASVSEQP